jgi:hypothetical protein
MALDARHRSSIHRKLVPLFGEDDANALMSEFPSVEAGEHGAIRDDFAELRADIAALRTDLTWRWAAIVATWTAVLGPLLVLD